MNYKKVLAGDYNIRYIDNGGKWYKKEFNGKFKASKPMLISKTYGTVNIELEDEGVFGYRVISETLTVV